MNIGIAIRLLGEKFEVQQRSIELMQEAATVTGDRLFFFPTNKARGRQYVAEGLLDDRFHIDDWKQAVRDCQVLWVRNIGGQSKMVRAMVQYANARNIPVHDRYIWEQVEIGQLPVSRSKLEMFNILTEAGVSTPATQHISWEQLLSLSDQQIYGKVLKISRGGRRGKGTYMMRKVRGKSKRELVQQDLWDNHTPVLGDGLLLQDWIKSERGDWRIIVAHGRIVGCFRRGKRKSTFQATASQKSRKVAVRNIPAELADMCRASAEAMGLSIASIDAITDLDGNHWVIEINESPSFTVFNNKTKVNPMIPFFQGLHDDN